MRDNEWLAEKLYSLWENYFVDVPRPNRVLIAFGRKSSRQLGCIRWADRDTRGLNSLLKKQQTEFDDPRVSVITITGHFKDEQIPEQVVLGTIAHEMCHYAHGFNSPLQQLFNHPHKGGVIRKEMTKRGLGTMYRAANSWLKSNWAGYLRSAARRR